MSTIYKDFDLPKTHLGPEGHFAPPKARDQEEIERRQAQPRGVLVLEAQHDGIEMACDILPALRQSEDITFAADVLAASGLNTAWYLFGKDAPVQRRRLKLEILATDDPEQRPTTFMLLNNAVDDLKEALVVSNTLIKGSREQLPDTEQKQKVLGRIIGHASLTLSCASLGDQIGYEMQDISNHDIQDLARRRGLHALGASKEIGKTIGTAPSLAQLADPDSDLSVYWRRNAPDGALAAYEQAAAA